MAEAEQGLETLRALMGISVARLADECRVSAPWMRSILRSGQPVPDWIRLKLLRLALTELRRQSTVMKRSLQAVVAAALEMREPLPLRREHLARAGNVSAEMDRLIEEIAAALAAGEEQASEYGTHLRPRRGRPRKARVAGAAEQRGGRPADPVHSRAD